MHETNATEPWCTRPELPWTASAATACKGGFGGVQRWRVRGRLRGGAWDPAPATRAAKRSAQAVTPPGWACGGYAGQGPERAGVVGRGAGHGRLALGRLRGCETLRFAAPWGNGAPRLAPLKSVRGFALGRSSGFIHDALPPAPSTRPVALGPGRAGRAGVASAIGELCRNSFEGRAPNKARSLPRPNASARVNSPKNQALTART